jgi:hypothetical protein
MARLLALGLALGGAAGARLSQSFGLTASRNTLLRVIRRAPCPAITPPQVLSVDEFALRKRHTYGTLLVDLARRRPLALLPDREVATVASRCTCEIGRRRMRKRPAWEPPGPSRWRIGSICCRIWRTC